LRCEVTNQTTADQVPTTGGGIDLRTQRWTVRRQRLEQLAQRWVPPLQLTPVTADLDEATEGCVRNLV
jgi:hypothetical protein